MCMKIKQVSYYQLRSLWTISKLISSCGYDMYNKYGLKHWYNSEIKTFLIILYKLCTTHQRIFIVLQDKNTVATFQTEKRGHNYYFSKLAVLPRVSGNGIGGECINVLTKQAKELGCEYLTCEVYEKSLHALKFYLNKGFVQDGVKKTRKYVEYKLIKRI